MTRGWEWFGDYLPGLVGLLFMSALSLVPGAALYGIGKGSKRSPLAFWFAAAASIGFLLWAHGTVNLRASSTAPIALLFIPVYTVGAMLAGWAVGWLLHSVVSVERRRLWLVRGAVFVAVGLGIGIAMNESSQVAQREARFPVVAVSELPLTKRTVYPCCPVGRVEVLALDNFDSDSGSEIAALGVNGLTLLKPGDYAIKAKSDFAHESCDRCVSMYPYLVPDGKGGLLVASSDGVAASQGRLHWRLHANGFTRLVPIPRPAHGPAFFAYHSHERVDLHDTDGKVLWSAKTNVADVGLYVGPQGERLPFAVCGHGKSRTLQIYELNGNLRKTLALPEWASNVEAIAWPKPGNLLIGGGRWIGILDPDGKEILRHAIRGTSFNPYHGPDGAAVRFAPAAEPYLAVMSHGSSGYARSVLVVFDPNGRLVWQEELNKLRTMLAVSRHSGKVDVLLVGGMDGVVEYSLADGSSTGQGRDR